MTINCTVVFSGWTASLSRDIAGSSDHRTWRITMPVYGLAGTDRTVPGAVVYLIIIVTHECEADGSAVQRGVSANRAMSVEFRASTQAGIEAAGAGIPHQLTRAYTQPARPGGAHGGGP